MSNQQQYDEIINSKHNKICVIAGPGSGKTTGILIPKAQQILSDTEIDAESILLLSFSRISAEDLKNKVKKKFEDRAPKASTLHSYCLAFLLSEDNHDARKRVNSIMLDFEKDVLISDLKTLFGKKYKKNEIKKLLKDFSAAWATKPHDQVFNEPEDKRSFKQSIINWLEEHEALMMEEIVYLAVDLARKSTDSTFLNGPKYVFVDEYQDLNILEQEFIDMLIKDTTSLLVVGDPDQSIYSFKFAYREGITSFAARKEVKNFSLEYTGRCAKKIVEKANIVLKQIDPQRTNLLKPLPTSPEGEVVIKRMDYQDEEFCFVLDSIKADIEQGILPKDIVILVPKKKLGKTFVEYGNTNKNTEDFEFSLSHKPEFEDLEQERILLFGLVANPNSILHFRSFIGLIDRSDYGSKEVDQLKKHYGSYKEILEKAKADDFGKKNSRIIKICERIEYLRGFIKDNTGEKEKKIELVIDELFPDNVVELKEIRSIMISLKSDEDTPKSLYAKFTDYLRTVNTKENQIKVMTILGSKGLDAHSVYIVGCNDGNLPGENHSAHLTDTQYKEEQKRFLYVGITRAKRKLVITWSKYIPFEQARGLHTGTTGTVRKNGKIYGTVGMSEFIQDLL